MHFSRREKKDLFFAGIIISLAFAFLLGGGYQALFSFDASFLFIFAAAFITAGTGFLLHELMHKYIAQSYGLRAEFRAFYGMLWIALVLSLFGFIFAAPGAVFIQGNMSREKNGKISVAGPASNIVLALLFGALLLIHSNGMVGAIFAYGLNINSLLATFNMIPILPLDGAKVLAWNKKVYVGVVVVAAGLYIFGQFMSP
jgi:Zn-dependent protease